MLRRVLAAHGNSCYLKLDQAATLKDRPFTNSDVELQITETPLDSEMLEEIRACIARSQELLGVDLADAEPKKIVEAVDYFAYEMQKGRGPEFSEDDPPEFLLGCLWGEQLVRKLGWEWASVVFDDDDATHVVGVFTADRSLAIYPFYFIHGCLEDDVPVTVVLSFNMLVDGSRIPQLPAKGYENVMDHVHHAVPRD